MFQDLLIKIAKAMSRESIPYMIIGGQAVLYYGEPRLTRDIDITLGIDTDELTRVLCVVEKTGLMLLVKENIEAFVQETMVLPAIDQQRGIRIDFIFSFSPYERQAIERAKEVELNGARVRFCSLEDLIIHKIIAGRPRDLEDTRSVLLKNPNYDAKYIRDWLQAFAESMSENLLEIFLEIEKDIKQ